MRRTAETVGRLLRRVGPETESGTGDGDITAVNAGDGLTGGTDTGDATLDVGAGIGVSVSNDSVELDTSYTNTKYVNEGQNNSINSAMIQDDAVTSHLGGEPQKGVSPGDLQEGGIHERAVTCNQDQGRKLQKTGKS